jgi:16S rRNA (guanine966-N2)-methyltransferase
MRIISGTAGGIPLIRPKHDLRPTTDRTREAVFSILGGRVSDARVADLFAGTGAYGLEALSRGARSADFVERDRVACELLRRNAEKTRLDDRAEIRHMDVFRWMKSARGRFDIIFADPPFRKSVDDADDCAALLGSSHLVALLDAGGIFVLESAAAGESVRIPQPWKLLDQRRYGSSLISFLEPGNPPALPGPASG